MTSCFPSTKTTKNNRLSPRLKDDDKDLRRYKWIFHMQIELEGQIIEEHPRDQLVNATV